VGLFYSTLLADGSFPRWGYGTPRYPLRVSPSGSAFCSEDISVKTITKKDQGKFQSREIPKKKRKNLPGRKKLEENTLYFAVYDSD
jgi:hypothetical protein